MYDGAGGEEHLPSDAVDGARDPGVNKSKVAETGTAATVGSAREEAWLKANGTAIKEHGACLDRDGMTLEPPWPE